VEPSLVLIPSPLLGPATWEPTAQALERRGRQTRLANLQCVASAAPPYWPAGVDAIVRSARGEPVVLVPHSNSGLFMPAVIDALGDQVRGVVFVDAALPGAGYYAQRDFLTTLAGADGLLPPWTSWWQESGVAELFPNAEVRTRVEAEQARMPLAYYDHLPPAPDGWDRPPCAYIWFAEPYDSGAEQASEHGWPTRHVPGHHLNILVDPDAVAAAVLELAHDMR
jgi:pimeloyl-ACP methyl ester carboxylesterase